jgi:hypothetical protein
MILNIIEDEKYKKLITKQLVETLHFLLSKDQEFSITANMDALSFEPELPSSIKEQMDRFPLFILSNYTYTTIVLNEKQISFEAGFGSENFGSTVNVPIHSIFQVIVDESILYLNSVATVDKFNENKKEKSINIFKNNPRNNRFS